jgi:hypothetical protein
MSPKLRQPTMIAPIERVVRGDAATFAGGTRRLSWATSSTLLLAGTFAALIARPWRDGPPTAE